MGAELDAVGLVRPSQCFPRSQQLQGKRLLRKAVRGTLASLQQPLFELDPRAAMDVTKHENLCSAETPRTRVACSVWGFIEVVRSTMNDDFMSTPGCLADGSTMGQLEGEFAGSESGP